MPQRVALLIGTGTYKPPLRELVGPPHDIATLARILSDPLIGGFDDVIPLLDEGEATIRRHVGKFLRNRRRDDLVLVYVSGHGVLDDNGLLYFAATDTEEDAWSSTAVPASFLRHELDQCGSRRQIVILDCCNSASFGREFKSGVAMPAGSLAALTAAGYGRFVITASDATQKASDARLVPGGIRHSLFTHYLIEGIATGAADKDADKQVTINELWEYASRALSDSGSAQQPKKFSEEAHGEIVIARVPPTEGDLVAANAIRKPSAWEDVFSGTPMAVLLTIVNLAVASVAVSSIEDDDWSVTAGGGMYAVSTAICVALISAGYLARPPRSLGVVWTFFVFAGFMFTGSATCSDWSDIAPCSTGAFLLGGISVEAALLILAAALYGRRHSVQAFNRQFGPGLGPVVAAHSFISRACLVTTVAILAAGASSHAIFLRNDRGAIIVYCVAVIAASIVAMRLPNPAARWLLRPDRHSLLAGRITLVIGTIAAIVFAFVVAH